MAHDILLENGGNLEPGMAVGCAVDQRCGDCDKLEVVLIGDLVVFESLICLQIGEANWSSPFQA
jgi:hypothetical protein